MFKLFRRQGPAAPPVRAGARPAEAKASAAGPVMAFHGTGRACWTPRDQVSLTRTCYAENVVGFRAVRMVAEAAAAIPLLLSEDGERRTEHPVIRLLAQPNPGQDGRGFLEHVYGHILLAGNAYLEAAAPDSSGLPRELHTLRPDRMRVIPGEDGWPAAYEYAVGRAKHRWEITPEARPILHVRSFHPLDDHYGLSPLAAAAASIDVHNAAARWTKALLDNAARPSGAIVFQGGDGPLSEEQFQRLSREIEEHHQGARNAGRPMLLEGGLDWRPMGYSPADMEFLATKNAAARDIALAFGIPPMLLGLPGDNTYSNYQEANRAFYRQTVLPLVRKLGSAMASWLGEGAGMRLALEPDLDQVPALGAERDAQWKRIANADFLEPAEKRALLGLPPRPIA
ncbi:MAG: phage portal protein [Paracoccaceae bacterium]